MEEEEKTFAMQQLSKHISIATNQHSTITETMEVVFFCTQATQQGQLRRVTRVVGWSQ